MTFDLSQILVLQIYTNISIDIINIRNTQYFLVAFIDELLLNIFMILNISISAFLVHLFLVVIYAKYT